MSARNSIVQWSPERTSEVSGLHLQGEAVPRHLLVTNDYPPKVGGIQNYLWELYRRFTDEETVILTSPYEGDATFDGAQPQKISRHERFWLSPTPDVRRRIDEVAQDAGAHLAMLDPAVPLGLLGPSLAVPYGLIIHGTEAVVPARVPGLQARFARVLAQAQLVVSSSDWATKELEAMMRRHRGLPVPPIVYVPPGVDVERFKPLSATERAAARRRLGIDPDALVVTSVSRLVPRKGMDRLIAATARLQDRYPTLQLLIAGRGRDEKRLRSLIARAGAPVRLLGRVDAADLPALYGVADVFAMLCRNRWAGLEQEGFGIVFVEAAACAVPQIAGASGGAAEAVADGETGLVVHEPHMVDAVSHALDRLLSDPDLRMRLGLAARRRVVHEFAHEVLAERYRTAIAQALGGAPG